MRSRKGGIKGRGAAVFQLLAALLLFFALAGCGGATFEGSESSGEGGALLLPLLGYTIQVGAFTQLENAVRLMQLLDDRGLDAYYFRHESGLYKVRFGNFSGREAACKEAESLQAAAIIGEFYIVAPADFAAATRRHYRDGMLREHLVRTAKRFIGVPYRWGGSSAKDGFDCSGLTMTVYRMNGLNMPRDSRTQFQYGEPVSGGGLKPGDLVFFATNGGRQVTHVGIYIGAGSFIHAPKEGKEIRTASLESDYFRTTYVGGRSYLPEASGR